ncbi:hypothetical protein CHS0354_037635 [Potamilus streckersoni]|uniref:Sushi domain-containing protein n=1 Tax=Potamilus streckersoni TaxID=2493646 RepID=A0AAE0W8Q5_9BIVA|nr:hypothetical protein CHS0354_037635 [Potamilus streckersoni]
MVSRLILSTTITTITSVPNSSLAGSEAPSNPSTFSGDYVQICFSISAVSCPSPRQPLHGSLVQKAYNGVFNIYLSTVRYDCDMGYRMVGPQFRMCQADRTWSGNDTRCEEILCDKPSPPQNGHVYFTDNSENVGSQIEYMLVIDYFFLL